MKKIFLFAILFAVSASGNHIYAQKCKFDSDKEDEFTKEHVRSVKHPIGSILFRWWMLMEQKGPKFELTLQVSTTGKMDDVFAKGSKMLFKLENGKVVEIVADADYMPAFHVESNTIITNWLPKGVVSEENMKALSESPITAVRVNVANKDVNAPNITGKEADKIQQSATCFLMKD